MLGLMLWFLNHSLKFGSCWGKVIIQVNQSQILIAPLFAVRGGSIMCTLPGCDDVVLFHLHFILYLLLDSLSPSH